MIPLWVTALAAGLGLVAGTLWGRYAPRTQKPGPRRTQPPTVGPKGPAGNSGASEGFSPDPPESTVDMCAAFVVLGVPCHHWHVPNLYDYVNATGTYESYWLQHWQERHGWRGPAPLHMTHRGRQRL